MALQLPVAADDSQEGVFAGYEPNAGAYDSVALQPVEVLRCGVCRNPVLEVE